MPTNLVMATVVRDIVGLYGGNARSVVQVERWVKTVAVLE